jgi:DNA-directed RNA polymerase sigma subunit (sigma70/sigma32)
MKKLYYKLYLKYKGIPHRNHVKSTVNKRQILNATKRRAAYLYIKGADIEEIGLKMNVTRERVRQLLYSVVR